jgi:hypothetical protein
VGQLGQLGDALPAGCAPRGPEFKDVRPGSNRSIFSPFTHPDTANGGAEIQDLIISPRLWRRETGGDCPEGGQASTHRNALDSQGKDMSWHDAKPDHARDVISKPKL